MRSPAFHDDASIDLLDESTIDTTGLSSEELSILGLIEKLGCCHMNTAFAGIDAPGTAVHQIHAYLSVQSKRSDIPLPKHNYAIEWNESAQDELLAHPGRPRCLFGNIESFLMPNMRSIFRTLHAEGKLNSVLLPLVRDSPAKVVRPPPGSRVLES